MEHKGIWTAIVTPFKKDQQIDWDAFDALLEKQKTAGIRGVVVSGTTGEAPTLTVQEKLSLIRRAKTFGTDDFGVMAGTGGNNTQQSIELSRLAVEAGADSLLVVTPPYNKPSLTGLKEHFKAISNAVQVPICLYHVPGRTAQALTAEHLAEVIDAAGLSLMKEASGDIGLFGRTTQKLPKSEILSGDDPTLLASVAVGGAGAISVLSNIFPEETVRIQKLFMSGKNAEATRLQLGLMPFIDALFVECNPCPTKYVLSKMNLCENIFRLPLVPVSISSEQLLDRCFEQTQSLLKEV